MPQQSSLTNVMEPDAGAVCRFALFCTLFLLTAVWLEPQLGPLNRATALLSAKTLTWFGYAPLLNGDLITLSGFAVRIVSECTSLYATLLLAAFILAWPATWCQRLAGIVAGGVVIEVVNLLRIALVTVIGTRDPVRFEIIHVYLGQVVMLLLVVGCCQAWRGWITRELGGGAFLFRAVCWATILFLPWLMVHKIYLAGLDALVRWCFALLYPQYLLTTPQPLLIYNHVFSQPVFIALLIATAGISRRRRIIGGVAGILVLALGHALFRTTHVILTAYGVTAIEQLHQAVYLIGQFVLPLLLWLLVVRRFNGEKVAINRLAATGLMLVIVALLLPGMAEAATSLQLFSNGRGTFVLRGENLNRVTAVGVKLSHDSLDEGTPQVSLTGVAAQARLKIEPNSYGALEISLEAKPAETTLNNMGSALSAPIEIGTLPSLPDPGGNKRRKAPAPVKPLPAPQPSSYSGSTTLANIILPGPITHADGWIMNAQGGKESVVVTYKNPPEGSWPKPRLPLPVAPSVQQVTAPASEPTVINLPSRQAVADPAPKATKPAAPRVFRREPAVSEQFMELPGEQNAAALTELLARTAARAVRQAPSIAVADGVTPLQLIITPVAEQGELASMLLTGASVVEVVPAEGGSWHLTVLPLHGACAASLTLLQENAITEFPLTLVPVVGDTTACLPVSFLVAVRELIVP